MTPIRFFAAGVAVEILAGTPIPPHFLALVALSLGFVVGHLGRICP